MKIYDKRTKRVLYRTRANSLIEAKLMYRQLAHADLQDADLEGANLQCADLRGADLCRANLRGANLWDANLWDANLLNADLRGAKIGSAVIPREFPICRMDFGGWSICIDRKKTSIGCQTHSNEEWLGYKPSDVEGFACGASEWWQVHGPAVKAAIKVVIKKAKAAGWDGKS